MERYLREWLEDAANKGAYDTAIFVGDKLLDLSGSDKDAIRLAHLYASSNNFYRAHVTLERQTLIHRFPEAQLLAARCLVKLGRFDQALDIMGEHPPSHLLQPRNINRRSKTPRLESDGRNAAPSRHGKNGSISTRLEAARQVSSTTDNKEREEAANRRYHAGMCYLRGICYAKGNAFDRAKECYVDAVRIDVQCFEAFDQLMKNALMTPQEESELLESLDFDSITVSTPAGTAPPNGNSSSASQQAADLTRMLYTTRLSKYSSTPAITTSLDTLSTHYRLASNPDMLLSRAELLFTQCRFRDALVLTDSVLANDRYCFAALPVHLACLHELSEKNALFLLAHDFADHHPEDAATWLAVGVYYLTIGKIPEARRFFSKSSMMDPHFGPAWIGFAHTFAAEGEHDQASSAYATAARLFQGTHLPQLFLGMQNLHLQHLGFANEYLKAAHSLCETDPLLLNEMAVVYYHEDRLEDAVTTFRQALDLAVAAGSEPRAFTATHTNLGHALRRLGHWEDALAHFDIVLRQGTREASVFAAKGLLLMEMGHGKEAVSALNEALSVSPQDAIAGELMVQALQESLSELDLDIPGGAERDEDGTVEMKEETGTEKFEDLLKRKKGEAKGFVRKGKGRGVDGGVS
ncbi:MAG: anaphase promoting complex subunit cdc16 [Chrysothrix sp. TS-e1954]|nr:MAG: anaphase promoting complex subunit cdc16 [Chrysothrix sp. TS-e1954]